MGEILDLDSFMKDGYILMLKNTADNRDISVIVDKNKKGSIEAAEAISVLNKAKRRRLNIISEPISYIILSSFVPAEIALVTPVKQMEDKLASPLIKEIFREKIPTSLKSVSSLPRFITGSSSTKVTSLMNIILEAARIIY
jgi:hypothetical protein